MQFRWEIFNVVNHVNFNAPMTALNSANFGQDPDGGGPAHHAVRREVQFLMKN